MQKEICVYCEKEMILTSFKQKGLDMKGYQCLTCKKRIFNQEQFHEAMMKLRAQRLRKEYNKKPIKIGNSIGVIFPKDMVEAYNLKDKHTRLSFKPNMSKNKIEISVES